MPAIVSALHAYGGAGLACIVSLTGRTRTSAQNDAYRLPGKIRELRGTTKHFCIHIEQPQTTEDARTGLRSEIEHHDSLGNMFSNTPSFKAKVKAWVYIRQRCCAAQPR